MANVTEVFFDDFNLHSILSFEGSTGTITPPMQVIDARTSVEWFPWEIPIHAVSNFFLPLAVYFLLCVLFDEKRFDQAENESERAKSWQAIRQHLWQAASSSLSLWFWTSLLLNVAREEPNMTTVQCVRNVIIHFFMSDALFFWCHYLCHQQCSYFLHKQHHSHKATPSAETKMTALSGTCVSFLDMLIIGHTPTFLPCFVLSLPFAWMIGYVLFLNFWISLLHCVGSKTGILPYTGIFVHPHDHHAHHKYGRENVNFGVLLTGWDRLMGTYQRQDPEHYFYIGTNGTRQPHQPLLKIDGKLNLDPYAATKKAQ